MPITTTPSGGPQGEFSTYTPIYAQTLSSTAASITFSNIPTTFTDLVLVASMRADTVTFNNMNFPILRLNDDSSSGLYSITSLFSRNTGSGDASVSARASSQNEINFGGIPTTNMSSGIFSTWTSHFLNYSNNTINKTIINRVTSASNLTTSDGTSAGVGLWRNTAPIHSITLTPTSSGNFVSGSTFTLYGIKAAFSQFIPTKATGGDIVVSDGTYAYHAFLTSGIFAPAQALTADILVVAGGGAGSGTMAAGGGAGGLLGFTSQSLTAIPYTCTVGSGGAYAGNTRVNGINSQFGALTAAVGGGGGGWRSGSSATATGATGGSGGGSAGAGYSSGGGGSGTANQGSAGGTFGSSIAAGGGGGASGVGGSADALGSGRGGSGGAGATFNSTVGGGAGPYAFINSMAAATKTGQLSGGNYYYAGGGGGGSGGTSTLTVGGAAGLGGGGAGGNGSSTDNSTTLLDGTPGVLNTGGGGGGGGQQQGAGRDGRGANGGSGIIIVRYTL
jgi:hypothetical protein